MALAKGGQLYAMTHTLPSAALNSSQIHDLVLADAHIADLLANKEVGFLNALPLSPGEARPWQGAGCGQHNCLQVTLVNYSDGGTVEAVVNMDQNEVVGQWLNPQARPGGSPYILPQAMAIAAADPQVQTVLGDIGAGDPAMIPMSGWLLDDDCREDWCVDLTFHDPSGTGRIFHVFINMAQNKVARTFYTRARPERSYNRPPEQRNAYSDGCLEQHGWSVCWEMTAHDGVHFYDAGFQGTTIFTSTKITQVEAWYPSWPGGYRDEIGFAASVPPFGDTGITDLGDGFEVRQLFTEFTHWPNCICCYRYEQVMRFHNDGGFEARFVSHGPGCDDLSVYRPFWRIDLDLNGPDNDQVWQWDRTEWVEMSREFETHPFIRPVSPDGFKLATIDGEVSYRWRMERDDPLSLDEARLFGISPKEAEGQGAIPPGPGDTFEPPRQWLDGDPLSGGDIVLWFVPSLKTKKGGPWYCMPDPEPDFSPCQAILQAKPAGELVQPTEEEVLAAIEITAVPTLTLTTTPMPTPTPRPIQGNTAEEIILNSGCGACHAIGELGEKGKVGPDLSFIGETAVNRIDGMSATEYLRQSILDPNAFITPTCPNGPCLANIMPRDYAMRLSSDQVEMMVAFLLEQRGETAEATPLPTPARIGDDTTATEPLTKAFPAPKMAPAQDGSTNLPYLAIQILLVSLVFLLSLFRLLKHPN